MNPQLTKRELDALSAWWATGSVKEAAAMLGTTPQTVKNQLYMARIRVGAANNAILVQKHLKVLRSAAELIAQHNVGGSAAA